MAIPVLPLTSPLRTERKCSSSMGRPLEGRVVTMGLSDCFQLCQPRMASIWVLLLLNLDVQRNDASPMNWVTLAWFAFGVPATPGRPGDEPAPAAIRLKVAGVPTKET